MVYIAQHQLSLHLKFFENEGYFWHMSSQVLTWGWCGLPLGAEDFIQALKTHTSAEGFWWVIVSRKQPNTPRAACLLPPPAGQGENKRKAIKLIDCYKLGKPNFAACASKTIHGRYSLLPIRWQKSCHLLESKALAPIVVAWKCKHQHYDFLPSFPWAFIAQDNIILHGTHLLSAFVSCPGCVSS